MPKLEEKKNPVQQQRPSTAKNKIIIFFFKKEGIPVKWKGDLRRKTYGFSS